MDVNGADGHDLLPVSRGELADQHGDEGVQLTHLLSIVFLHCVLISLLQAGERKAYIGGPPDLSAGESHLWKHTHALFSTVLIITAGLLLIILSAQQ